MRNEPKSIRTGVDDRGTRPTSMKGGLDTMRIGLIDVIDWQTEVDFKSGRSVKVKHPLVDMAGEVLRKHPYPGDLTPGASRWVTDAALDINSRYQPNLMLLTYSRIFFSSLFQPSDKAEQAARIRETFDEVQRFLEISGFAAVIVGLGDLTPMMGFIDSTGLDALTISGGMSTRYAGLFGASSRDLKSMANHPQIGRIIDRDAFRAQFGGIPEFYRRFPDHLLVAKEGYIFRGVGSTARPLSLVPRYDQYLPLHTRLGTRLGPCPTCLGKTEPGTKSTTAESITAESITDVSNLVLSALQQGAKVALILVEGVGCESFPLPFQQISNTCNWHCYSVGEGQYLTLTTGRHFIERPYPPACPYYLDNDETQPYPFSGIFNEMPPGTIGQRYSGRSVAVGSRSILTHVAAGTDITIECFARELYNHGVMAMIELHDQAQYL